jgi:hypothetical protein
LLVASSVAAQNWWDTPLPSGETLAHVSADNGPPSPATSFDSCLIPQDTSSRIGWCGNQNVGWSNANQVRGIHFEYPHHIDTTFNTINVRATQALSSTLHAAFAIVDITDNPTIMVCTTNPTLMDRVFIAMPCVAGTQRMIANHMYAFMQVSDGPSNALPTTMGSWLANVVTQWMSNNTAQCTWNSGTTPITCTNFPAPSLGGWMGASGGAPNFQLSTR